MNFVMLVWSGTIRLAAFVAVIACFARPAQFSTMIADETAEYRRIVAPLNIRLD